MGWRSLAAEGQLPAGADKADGIWGEGTPDDIEAFDGRRVVLLGAPPMARTWTAEARFPGLKGELEVLEQLDAAAVQTWLRRLAAAAHPNA